jgi:hypothetical protein
VKAIVLLASALMIASCATSKSSEPAQNSTPPPAADEPRTVTDLSQIAPGGKTGVTMPESGVQLRSANSGPDRDVNTTVQQNIERLVVANANNLRYRESRAEAPGETSLLNEKAQKFSEFSYQLLNQTLTAARGIEPDKLDGRKLPADIAPTVLTAVMDSQGRLTEIAIESHSGDRQVDQIIIDSCKKGLWSRNPPGQAVASDGTYRLRVRGLIRAYKFDFKGRYHYETQLGLGIL